MSRHILEIPYLIKEYERLLSLGGKDDSYDIPDDPKPDVDYEKLIEDLKYEKECWSTIPNYIRGNGGSSYFDVSYDKINKIYSISFDSIYIEQLQRRLRSYEKTKGIKLSYENSHYTRTMRMIVVIDDIRKER